MSTIAHVVRNVHRGLAVGAAALVTVSLAACGSSHIAGPTPLPNASAVTPAGTTPAHASSASETPSSSSIVGTSLPSPAPVRARAGSSTVPVPEHVVVVVEENHSAREIVGRPDAGYFTELAARGASMTQMYAITHPSQPNYVALFSGSTHGLTSDSCPHSYEAPTLADQLAHAGMTFTGYAESLPRPGFAGCTSGDYARKHAPWTNFRDLRPSIGRPFTEFPSDFSTLPTVSFVIPNLQHDMHDGTVAQADRWLEQHLGGYRTWAMTHHSLLVVTWDEDDHSDQNRIPTIIAGQDVRPGKYAEHATLYRLLRTVEWLYHLPGLAASTQTAPITDIWKR